MQKKILMVEYSKMNGMDEFIHRLNVHCKNGNIFNLNIISLKNMILWNSNEQVYNKFYGLMKDYVFMNYLKLIHSKLGEYFIFPLLNMNININLVEEMWEIVKNMKDYNQIINIEFTLGEEIKQPYSEMDIPFPLEDQPMPTEKTLITSNSKTSIKSSEENNKKYGWVKRYNLKNQNTFQKNDAILNFGDNSYYKKDDGITMFKGEILKILKNDIFTALNALKINENEIDHDTAYYIYYLYINDAFDKTFIQSPSKYEVFYNYVFLRMKMEKIDNFQYDKYGKDYSLRSKIDVVQNFIRNYQLDKEEESVILSCDYKNFNVIDEGINNNVNGYITSTSLTRYFKNFENGNVFGNEKWKILSVKQQNLLITYCKHLASHTKKSFVECFNETYSNGNLLNDIFYEDVKQNVKSLAIGHDDFYFTILDNTKMLVEEKDLEKYKSNKNLSITTEFHKHMNDYYKQFIWINFGQNYVNIFKSIEEDVFYNKILFGKMNKINDYLLYDFISTCIKNTQNHLELEEYIKGALDEMNIVNFGSNNYKKDFIQSVAKEGILSKSLWIDFLEKHLVQNHIDENKFNQSTYNVRNGIIENVINEYNKRKKMRNPIKFNPLHSKLMEFNGKIKENIVYKKIKNMEGGIYVDLLHNLIKNFDDKSINATLDLFKKYENSNGIFLKESIILNYFEMTDDLPKEIKSLIYNNLDTTLFEKFGDGKEATEMLKKAIGFQDFSGKKKSKLIETWNTINPRERLMILKKITDGKKIY